MTPRRLRLLTEVRDLQILDSRMHDCGIVDDVELEGGPGEGLRVKALLVGPGAYRGRMPAWAFALVRWVAGDRITRVPLAEIDTIHTAVILKCTATEVGLHRVENRVRKWIPRKAAM